MGWNLTDIARMEIATRLTCSVTIQIMVRTAFQENLCASPAKKKRESMCVSNKLGFQNLNNSYAVHGILDELDVIKAKTSVHDAVGATVPMVRT